MALAVRSQNNLLPPSKNVIESKSHFIVAYEHSQPIVKNQSTKSEGITIKSVILKQYSLVVQTAPSNQELCLLIGQLKFYTIATLYYLLLENSESQVLAFEYGPLSLKLVVLYHALVTQIVDLAKYKESLKKGQQACQMCTH